MPDPQLTRIISGGQTGADQGALFAARQLNLETGGFAPRNWRTDAGPASWLADYGLVETAGSSYPRRTYLNVLNSDGTLIFGDLGSKGSKLTCKFCTDLRRPVHILPWHVGLPTPEPEQFKSWLAKHRISILNVAGNRESRQPGITDMVKEFLLIALSPERGAE